VQLAFATDVEWLDMGRLAYWAAALGAAACGNVATQQQDARVDSAPDALTCTSSQLACGTCIDPMTNNDHCGGCDIECGGGTSCSSGHCVEDKSTCATIKAANPTAADGFYTLLDSTQVYCDMTTSTGYASLSYDNFNQTPAGYSLVTLSDLQTAATQKAFIALFNRVGGALPVLDNPMDGIGDCALKVSTDAAMALNLSGSLVIPATVGAAGPTSCLASYTVASLSFALNSGPVYAGTSMADTFFTTHPATEVVHAGTNSPALFWKKVLP